LSPEKRLRFRGEKGSRGIYLAESTPTTGYEKLKGKMSYTTFFEILE